MSNIDFVSREP